MATGASAFIRLQKPDNEISQGLQFWGNQMNDLGREYRDRNEREKIRRDKELSDWEKVYDNVFKFQSFSTVGRITITDEITPEFFSAIGYGADDSIPVQRSIS